MKFGLIYKVTNLINGKIYIGQTSGSLNKRWRGHCSGSKGLLARAIRKYKRENFLIEPLISALRVELLDHLEIEAIHENNSLQPFGYNISPGGHHQKKVANSTKQKMSIAAKSKKKPVFGTELLTGKKVAYPSLKEAERAGHGRYDAIAGCCKGLRKSSGGFVWSFEVYPTVRAKRTARGRPVIAIDLTTGASLWFPNCFQAQRQNQGFIGEIVKCCNGIYPSYKGKVWKFAPQ